MNIATISNSFCPSFASYSTYLARSASLRTKVQGEWCMTQSTILPITSPNVHQFYKFFYQPIDWYVGFWGHPSPRPQFFLPGKIPSDAAGPAFNAGVNTGSWSLENGCSYIPSLCIRPRYRWDRWRYVFGLSAGLCVRAYLGWTLSRVSTRLAPTSVVYFNVVWKTGLEKPRI